MNSQLKILTVVVATCCCTLVGQSDIVQSGSGGIIPENNVAGFTSSINISESEIVTGVSLGIVGFDHTWVGDLVATLTGPDGTSVTLFDRTGAQVNNDNSNVAGLQNGAEGAYEFSDLGADWWDEASRGETNYVLRHGVYRASDADGLAVELSAAFAGISSQGQWSLNISDRQGGPIPDVGSFAGFTLTLETRAVPEPTSSLALLAGFSWLMLTRRRRS